MMTASRSIFSALSLAGLCLAFLFVMPVFAEEDGSTTESAPVATAAPVTSTATPEASQPQEDKLPETPLEFIIASGIEGWIIIALSIIAVMLVLRNAVEIKRSKLLPEATLVAIEEAIDNGDWDGVINICQREDNVLTRVVGGAMSKLQYGAARMEDAMNEAANAQATILHGKLAYLTLIIGTAPMLGLLGTVRGMLIAFGTIAASVSASSAQLSGGIYVALLTTLFGLIVAIPTSVAFTFLRARVVNILMHLIIIMGDLNDRIRTQEENN